MSKPSAEEQGENKEARQRGSEKDQAATNAAKVAEAERALEEIAAGVVGSAKEAKAAFDTMPGENKGQTEQIELGAAGMSQANPEELANTLSIQGASVGEENGKGKDPSTEPEEFYADPRVVMSWPMARKRTRPAPTTRRKAGLRSRSWQKSQG